MRLTREYYTLNYRNFKDVSKFLDHVKSLEEQINTTNVEMTPDKRTLLCLTMALGNKSHYRSLVQIWGVTKDMTAQKAWKMLLESERRRKVDSGASTLVIFGLDHRDTSSCRYYGKTGHKEDLCWKKYPELIPDRYKSEEKEAPLTTLKKALLVGKKRLCLARSRPLSESQALGKFANVRSEVALLKWTGIQGELQLRWPGF